MKQLWRFGPLFCGVLLLGCAKDTTDAPAAGKHKDAQANRWIYEQMSADYLYNDYAKSVTPNYEQTCEEFYKTLLSARPTDEDGKHDAFGGGYFYSTMQRTLGKATRSSSGTYSYGLTGRFYTSPQPMLRVTSVDHGGVAERAGVRRGDWITSINGEAVTLALANSALRTGSGVRLELGQATQGAQGKFQWVRAPYPVTLPAATILTKSPVYCHTVISHGGRQIGYLLYNEFTSGPGGYSDKSYDNELKAAFRYFKQAGVVDLVVDLRYNGGGYVDCAALMASMIVPPQNLGQPFAKGSYNATSKRAPYLLDFLPASAVADCNLGLARLCVLVSESTASASELVINGLLPYMSVVCVGTQTEGKRVGSFEIASSEHCVTLHPITMRIFNKLGEANYRQGFSPAPSLEVDELTSYKPLLPFGDPNEALLFKALSYLSGGTSASFSRSSDRSTSSDLVPGPVGELWPPRTGGMIIPLP